MRKLDSSSNDFERGSSCTFMLQSPNIGPIQAVRISSDGGGFGAEWHLKDIQVTALCRGDPCDDYLLPFPQWPAGKSL